MGYEYQRAAAPAGGLRLHQNENTAGCSPKVIDALRRITREQVAFYPEYDAAVAACARRFTLAEDQIVVTNGLDEGILAVSIAALRGSPADGPYEGIVVVPAFEMYAACIDAVGGRVVQVPLEPDFGFPLERVLDAVTPRTRTVFLTNPNNPTGQTIGADTVRTIAQRAPDAAIFLDEAYADFAGETFLTDPSFCRLPNVIVGRTFAKAYGLAGIRAGAIMGPPQTLAMMRRIVPPYTLNVGAAIALPVALDDDEYYEWYLREVGESKALLYEALDRLQIRYWPSAANFVLTYFGDRCAAVIEGLEQKAIYVRDRSGDPGCAGCIRITTGVVEHTRACIAALEEVLCGAA